MEKQYITAQQLLSDSVALALDIAESGFRPDLIVGVWRGGTPVGIAVQEVLEFLGIDSDHIAIRTASYTGIGERTSVAVDGLEYLRRNLPAGRRLLLVDDVFDTGLSLDHVIGELQKMYGNDLPALRIATPYYKPDNNETGREPDYYLHTTAAWLVFPHELLGLSEEEVLREKPGLDEALKFRLLALHTETLEER